MRSTPLGLHSVPHTIQFHTPYVSHRESRRLHQLGMMVIRLMALVALSSALDDMRAVLDRTLIVAAREVARFADGARYFSVVDTSHAPAFGVTPGELWLLARNGRDVHTVDGAFVQACAAA